MVRKEKALCILLCIKFSISKNVFFGYTNLVFGYRVKTGGACPSHMLQYIFSFFIFLF